MFRSLYARLALALFLLFCLVGGLLFIAAMYSAHLYQQEISQRLNRDLAPHIVSEYLLMENGQVNQENLKQLFHELMIINPSVELYLLDPEGRILAFSAPADKVVRQQVSLAPIQAMLHGDQQLPVLGDDPRGKQRRKAFSVATIKTDGVRQGYIYAILGGEQVDDIVQLLKNSSILRWGSAILVSGLAFSLIAGLVIFALLTRRLRKLSQAMDQFKQSDFSKPVQLDIADSRNPDEIDRLGLTFSAMTDRIQSQVERLRGTDRLRRELIANVSHDLRTPLSSLKGYLETLIIKNGNLSGEDRREYLETAIRHADILNKRIEDLFELAKLDARELKPQLEPFSVAELVHDVSQKFALRCQQQGVSLNVDMDTQSPFAEADIGLIERALDNLIENALRNTPKGGHIQLMLSVDENQVRITVADTGRGIAADELPHIFERFYRKASPDNPQDGGAGLGLAIAQRIIALHGGTLSVESEIDRGSAFHFALRRYNFT